MTGFLLTAKQKLMLCINKRLYWRDRGHRRGWSCRGYWSHRGHGSHRGHRRDRTCRRYGSHRPYRCCGGCRGHWGHRRNRYYRRDGRDWCNRPHRSQHHRHLRLCSQHQRHGADRPCRGHPGSPSGRPVALPGHHGQRGQHGVYGNQRRALPDFLQCKHHRVLGQRYPPSYQWRGQYGLHRGPCGVSEPLLQRDPAEPKRRGHRFPANVWHRLRGHPAAGLRRRGPFHYPSKLRRDVSCHCQPFPQSSLL